MTDHRVFPMVVLLMDHVRRVSIEEARRIISVEHGEDASKSAQAINEDCDGMRYIDWRFGGTPYHIGTSSEPYINVVGEGKLDEVTGRVREMKWKMWEELPPDSDRERDAWMSHTAWMYVDALLLASSSAEDQQHLRHVLRIAGQLADERCVLLWLWAPKDQPKRVALPSPRAIASLHAGEWPH